jgi:hypothetical protein
MEDLLKLLISNFWIFLIYQIKFDQKTDTIKFMEKKPLPKDMTDFFKRHGVSMSKEERKLLQNFAHCCENYIMFEAMKTYLEETKDSKTEIVRQLLYMSHKLHKKMEAGIFFACFMASAENDGQYALSFNNLLFDYFQKQQLQEIELAIEVITKHNDQIAGWYEQTPVMIKVFSPLDKKYMERFSEEHHAFHYSNTKERYLVQAKKEQEQMLQYLKPPPPKKEEEPTKSNFDRWSDDDEIEYETLDRYLVLCSAEPHQCRCYICISQNLLFCNCAICLRKQVLGAEILEKRHSV